MGIGERLSILGDFRKVLQDFLAPELGELKVRLDTLSEGQTTIIQDVRDGFAAQTESMRMGFRAETDSRQEMEARLLREIKNSEEKVLMRVQLAEANLKMEQAMRATEEALREVEQLKREKTQ